MRAILAVETVLLALALALALVLNIPVGERIAFTADAVLLGLGAALLSNLILAPPALRSKAAWLVELRRRTEEILKRMVGDPPGPGAMLAVAYAGVAEELLFRGVLIPLLSGIMPVWLAVVVVGIGFGLLHPVTRMYIVLAALLGIFWGALYVWTDNLVVPMTAHAANNVIALVFYMRLFRR